MGIVGFSKPLIMRTIENLNFCKKNNVIFLEFFSAFGAICVVHIIVFGRFAFFRKILVHLLYEFGDSVISAVIHFADKCTGKRGVLGSFNFFGNCKVYF